MRKNMKAYHKEKRFRKVWIVGLVVTIILTTNSVKLEKSIARTNAYKPLEPITTAEDFYEDNWNQSIIFDYFDVLQPENKDKYLYLGLCTWDKMKNYSFLKQNPERAKFYQIKNVPSYVVNGYYDKNKRFYDTEGLKWITEGIKKAKQYASMEIKQVQDDNYLFKITGTDKRLNGKKLNVNLLVLKNEVNCDNNKDDFRTRILKRVAYQYVYKDAMGYQIRRWSRNHPKYQYKSPKGRSKSMRNSWFHPRYEQWRNPRCRPYRYDRWQTSLI